MRNLLSIFAVLALLAGVAVADDKKGGGGDKGGGSKVKVYDFSGDTIEGDLGHRHDVFCRPREDFAEGIAASAVALLEETS